MTAFFLSYFDRPNFDFLSFLVSFGVSGFGGASVSFYFALFFDFPNLLFLVVPVPGSSLIWSKSLLLRDSANIHESYNVFPLFE